MGPMAKCVTSLILSSLVIMVTCLIVMRSDHSRVAVDFIQYKSPSCGVKQKAIRPVRVENIHVAYPLEQIHGLQDELDDMAQNSTGAEDAIPEELLYQDKIFQMPFMPGENIISMTLYGSSLRYTVGALRNAELIKVNFPGWKLRIYTETPTTSRYGEIPSDIMASLRALGADFYFMQPGEDFIPPMMWRFLVADDEWVDRFIVRDTDARLTQRDAASVYDWSISNKPFTCIRDHPSHAHYAISGGMFGGIPGKLKILLRKSWRQLMKGAPSEYLADMTFLSKIIWPKVQNHSYCTDSVSCDRWPGAVPFPVHRCGYEHLGQVVNEHDLGRSKDIQILRRTGENKKCTRPPSYIFKLLEREEGKHFENINKR